MIKSKYCTYCNRETKQTLLHENQEWVPREVPYKEDKKGITKSVWTPVSVTESVFQCNGCSHFHIFIREWADPSTPIIEREWHYPQKVNRPQPNWIKDVDIDLYELLGEIYSNFNNDNFISFSICCRTLLDKLLTEDLGDIGGFQKKLDAFHQGGHITETQKNTLAVLIEAGNASAHRGFKTDPELSQVILDVVEHILKEPVNAQRAALHSQNIPNRK